MAVTNANARRVANYRYSPYGEEWASSGAEGNLIRFTGQYLDSDSGLYYLRAREYDSENGRFLEVDPQESDEFESDLSTYLYADDDPTLLSDPSGLDPSFAGKTINCKKNKPLCKVIYRTGYTDGCRDKLLRKALTDLYRQGFEFDQLYNVALGKARVVFNIGRKGLGYY